MHEQGHRLEPLPYCEGCSYLGERLQGGGVPGDQHMRPFCGYYQLHFCSVRQIDDVVPGCSHYNEGNI